MQNNMLVEQERELEAALCIKRIHCRIVCVHGCTQVGLGNPLVTFQG